MYMIVKDETEIALMILLGTGKMPVTQKNTQYAYRYKRAHEARKYRISFDDANVEPK